MTKLSDEQLAEIREGFAYRAADCQLCQADGLVRLLVLHIDALEEQHKMLSVAGTLALHSHQSITEAARMLVEMSESEADAVLQERIDALEAERAKGVRVFVPAYREANGYVGEAGTVTVVRENAAIEAEELNAIDADDYEIFVATKVIHPWVPVQENDRD